MRIFDKDRDTERQRRRRRRRRRRIIFTLCLTVTNPKVSSTLRVLIHDITLVVKVSFLCFQSVMNCCWLIKGTSFEILEFFFFFFLSSGLRRMLSLRYSLPYLPQTKESTKLFSKRPNNVVVSIVIVKCY